MTTKRKKVIDLLQRVFFASKNLNTISWEHKKLREKDFASRAEKYSTEELRRAVIEYLEYIPELKNILQNFEEIASCLPGEEGGFGGLPQEEGRREV